MRLTIVYDGAVGKEDKFYMCDLSTCGLPQNFWALQWEEWEPNKGHIEYNSPLIHNDEITVLPSWVDACLAKWQEAYDAEQATIAAYQQAAQQSSQQGT
jgi:hypothetical protein